MLTYGASLGEIPAVKEPILEVRLAYMKFNTDVLPLIENKNKVSIAVIYRGENLPHACGDPRRICYKVFRKKIDDTLVTLTLNNAFQLPFSSAFPMTSPSLEIYVMLESLSNLRKCLASAQISLGRRCRGLSALLPTNAFGLFVGTNSNVSAGTVHMSVRLKYTTVKAKSFSFFWSQKTRLADDEYAQQRQNILPQLEAQCENSSAIRGLLRQARKEILEQKIEAFSAPIAGEMTFNLKGLTSRIDELLVQMDRDGVVVVPMITRLKTGDCSASRFATFFLDSHPYRILATTPIPLLSSDTVAVCCASTFAFHASNYAMQIIEEEVFSPTAGRLLIGSLPFYRNDEDSNPQETKEPEPTEPKARQPQEGLRVTSTKCSHLRDLRTFMDKWREKYHFRRLPAGHPLRIFALFKRDEMLYIAATGCTETDCYAFVHSSSLYGIEIQAQQMINDAIVALKRQTAQAVPGKAKTSKSSRLTCLSTLLMTAVDYKGFRVVVMPLSDSIPEVLAWPQPLSERIRHEISYIENKLNICNLLRPICPSKLPRDTTILLSLKNRGADTMMLYRTCYALPLFSGKSEAASIPTLAQRLRTVAVEHSADMELALKNIQEAPQQTTLKDPTAPSHGYNDVMERSPFNRLYAPVDDLLHFITSKYQCKYREASEPVVCGQAPPGSEGQRLETLIKSVIRSVILNDVVAELERMDPYGPHDSISLTSYLHRRGINMRLLGIMYKRTRSPWVQQMLLVEIVERVEGLLRNGDEQDFVDGVDDDALSTATSDDSTVFGELVKAGGVYARFEACLA
ncbi:hypothetical protein cyc_00248 [Cyclospora cayetanensis]|uniref:CLU central domain-containing protein n=1 Tax=Cyclospora cayetanensis TaxID=88456 RepID=A0A1D3D9P7_9EIME|nr:hypothetical protein cyc_00248 [Cyclospora cayetanensis]